MTKKLVLDNLGSTIYHHTIDEQFNIMVVEQHNNLTGEITFTLRQKHFDSWSTENPITVLTNVSKLNVVTCGQCGQIFAHMLNKTELHCPYRYHQGDICDFPDLTSPDSTININ